MSGIAELDITLICKAGCISTNPSRQDAIEEIDASRDCIQDILRPADAHQIPRPVVGQEVSRHIEGLAELVACLADAHTPDRVTIEFELAKLASALRAKVGVRPALDDPEKRLVAAAMGCLASPRPQDRPLDGGGDLGLGGRQGGAMVQAHGHI